MLPRSDHARSRRWLPNDGGHRALGNVRQTRQHLLRMTAPRPPRPARRHRDGPARRSRRRPVRRAGVPAPAGAGRRPGHPPPRPASAKGVTFINLEDETGSLNVTCSVGLFVRYRQVAISSSALLVRGLLERRPEGVLNLVADRLQKLPLTVEIRSRDFR